MKLTILGANGRIGRHVLEQALAAGHEVAVLVRDPARLGVDPRRVRIVAGTIPDGDALERAITGADAVISAIGPDANNPDQVVRLRSGMRHTIAAMRRHGVRRIVNLSGPASLRPHDARTAARIAVRPALVNDGPRSERYAAGPASFAPELASLARTSRISCLRRPSSRRMSAIREFSFDERSGDAPSYAERLARRASTRGQPTLVCGPVVLTRNGTCEGFVVGVRPTATMRSPCTTRPQPTVKSACCGVGRTLLHRLLELEAHASAADRPRSRPGCR